MTYQITLDTQSSMIIAQIDADKEDVIKAARQMKKVQAILAKGELKSEPLQYATFSGTTESDDEA